MCLRTTRYPQYKKQVAALNYIKWVHVVETWNCTICLCRYVSESESGGEPRWYIGSFVPQLITTTNFPNILSCLVILSSPVRIAPFTLVLKPVSNRFTFKPVWPNHIHYVVYRKRFPKHIRGVYTAALNWFETALKLVWSASVNGGNVYIVQEALCYLVCISLQCCAHLLVCSATTYSGAAEVL